MHKKLIPFHPFLFAAFPVLFLYVNNIGVLHPNVIIAPLAMSVGTSAVLFFLLDIIFKDGAKAALVTSLFIILFYLFGHVYPFVKLPPVGAWIAHFHIRTYAFLLSAWTAIFIIGATLIARTRRELNVATVFFNAVAALLIVMSLMNIGIYRLRERGLGGNKEEPASADTSAIGSKKHAPLPNIYFIIVDSYEGQDMLKDLYEYDNSVFLNYLAGKGFYVVQNARANYCRTALSLASTLNLDYIDKLMGRHYNADSIDTEPLNAMLKYSKVSGFLKQHGYKTAAFSDWYPETDVYTVDIYMTSGLALDEFKIMLIKTTPIPALLKLAGFSDKFSASFQKRVLYKFDRLADSAGSNIPVFVFCHIEPPHPPFAFGQDAGSSEIVDWANDDEGNWMKEDNDLSKSAYSKAYLGQLDYVNKKLKTTIDAIISRSKVKPIIILQADHGPRSKLFWKKPDDVNLKECLSIVNAYYLPGGGEKLLYEGITPVNTFRVIFNYYFGTDYRMLEDRSFFSTAKHPYKFIDVTEIIRKR